MFYICFNSLSLLFFVGESEDNGSDEGSLLNTSILRESAYF